MATYVNDLRLKEIATGDESGTWGTSTNTNLELIGNAMGVGAEAIANASTHTITMADGVADEFRSTFLRLTGGGQACTVTLAPNTLSHTWIMRNETSATLTLTQGSGANVAIAAGQTKIVATDGAGSGAVVYEMDDLELAGNLVIGGDLTIGDDLTITDDLNVGDDINLTSDSSLIKFGADGDTTLTHTDGTGLTLNSTNKLTFGDADSFVQQSSDGVLRVDGEATIDLNASTAVTVSNDLKLDSDAAVLGFGTDNDVTLTHVADTGLLLNSTMAIQFNDASQFINAPSATVLDINATDEIELNATLIDINGNADVSGTVTATGTSVFASLDISGDIDVDGTANLDVVDIDGAVDMASTLTLAGNADFNGDLDVDGTTNLDVVDIDGAVDMASTLNVTGAITGTSATFTTADNNSQLVLKSTDADANVGPRLDLTRDSASPADGDLAGQIRFLADNDAGEETGVGFIRASLEDVSDGNEDGAIEVQTRINGTNRSRLKFISTETVFNESGQDLDFRVETNTDANALFVQGSSNRVMLGFNAQVAVAAINPHFGVVGTDNGSTAIGIARYSADTGGPRLVLSKSRNGSITTAGGTIVGSSDTTGMIMFSADDGSDMATRTARIQSQVSGTPGSDDMPGHLQFFTTADGASSETEHMRITSAGLVGIGTSSPGHVFSISSTDGVLADLVCTSSTAGDGARVNLYHDKTAADGDTAGYVDFKSNNDSGSEHLFGRIQVDATSVSAGSEDGRMRLSTLVNGSTQEAIRITSSVVINEGSNDMDFRVESDGNTHMVFVDAGNNRVGIGDSSPSTELTVAGDITATSSGPSIFLTDTDNNPDYQIKNGNGTFRIIDATNSQDRINCSSTETIINENSADLDFRIETDGSQKKFFVDGGNNVILVNNDAPVDVLNVGSTFQIHANSNANAGISIQRNTNNNSSAYINFAKSRGTAATSDFTVVQSGDALGRISFVGADGTNFGHQAAKISGVANANFAENDVPGRLEFYTTSDGGTTVTERMRIDSTGNVGIGTTTTIGARLELAANNASSPLNTLLFTDLDTATVANQQIGKIAFKSKDSSGDGELVRAFINCFAEDTTPSAAISFAVNAGGAGTSTTEAMRINSLGDLLLGTTSNFQNGSNNSGGTGSLHIARDNESCLFLKRASGNGNIVEFFRGAVSSAVGTISIDASSTSYNTSSDRRLKENIADAADAGSKLDAIKVRQFDWKIDGSHQDYGMVAQELQSVAPEAVTGDDDSDEMMSVDYSKLVPMLVKEIQSLRARVAQLETEEAS